MPHPPAPRRSAPGGSITFGRRHVEIDLEQRRVHKGGVPVKLHGRAIELLVALVERRGREVSKEELLAVVWPGLVVEDNNLQVHVTALRKLLGRDAIVTLHRRGYRFTLEPDETTLELPARLIGRHALAADVVGRLRQGRRALVLTGPGGAGKTALALAVADIMRKEFADGLAVVLLASVRDVGFVLAALATALGLEAADDQPIEAQIIGHLRARHMLLLLDNVEHLTGALPTLARLLAACPTVAVLATSRVRLQLPGEDELIVPPLALPDPEDDDDTALAAPAVQLFVTQGRSIGRDPWLDSAERAATRSICRRLDGLPLALELTAARLRLLPASALLARLKPTRDIRTEPQQTMHDTIGWSHDLLDSSQQKLFRRLSVFAGGWTAEAAAAVAGMHDERTLAALVDHNLIQRQEPVDGDTRFEMLETIREYALERLQASGEADSLAHRHAEYYRDAAVVFDRALRRSDRGEWLSRLRHEHDNLRAALRHALLQRADAALALPLVSRLTWWWYFGGHLLEGRDWQRAALALPCPGGSLLHRAQVLSGAARLAMYLGQFDEAIELGRDAVAESRAHGDRTTLAHALVHHALPMLGRDRTGALALIEESLALFVALDDPWGRALATVYLGILHALTPGAPAASQATARAHLEAGWAAMTALGDRWGSSAAAQFLSILALRDGDLDEARRHAQEVLDVASALNDNYRLASGLHQSARIELAAGDLAQALALATRSARISLRQGRRASAAVMLRLCGAIEARLGQPLPAVRLFACASNVDAPPVLLQTLTSPEMARLDAALEGLRESVAPDDFEAAWHDGSRMDVEDAVAGLARERGL